MFDVDIYLFRNLPSPTIPTATSTDIIDIINGVQDKVLKCQKLNEEQVRLFVNIIDRLQTQK